MAVNLSPIGGVAAQFLDNNGNPLTGGKIYTYAAGTTTPQATYTSANGATPHANPIILDAAGRVPGGEIWLTDGLQYKFVIKTSTDVQIGSYDNIIGINSNFVNYTNSQEFQTATAGQTVFTLTTMVYQPGTGSLSVFVDGVNQYGPGALYAYTETSDTVVTFNAGLHVGAEVKFTTSSLNASAATDAQQVSYIPPFTGSVATNVELKLSRTISVYDFGAVGNGVTDDTVAIQAAIDAASTIGGTVLFKNATFIVSTLGPKSNVTLDLCGGTIKLKDGTNERIFNGSSGGINFSILNGTLDGNKVNNFGNYNLSGASNFTDWDKLTFKNLTWQNVYRASLILGGTTKNVVLENIVHNNCGQANVYNLFAYALECYPGTSRIHIRNFSVNQHYGFGIHFYGTDTFSASNLKFETLTYNNVAIAITFTEATRGTVSNVYCNSVDGDNLECNNCTDISVENVSISGAGNRAVIMGDNGPGTFNERIVWRNVKTVSTGATYSLAINYIKNCTFDHFETDKTWTTLGVGPPLTGDRNNVISNSLIAGDITTSFTFYKKFHLKRVRFNNFYVNDHDGVVSTFSNPQVSGSFSIALANGATTYVDFNAFNGMGSFGFVCGRLRITAGLNNQQSTYHECLFLASNNNATLNLSPVTTVTNLVARTMTITADAANRRIAITNSTGADVQAFWAVELHKADQ